MTDNLQPTYTIKVYEDQKLPNVVGEDLFEWLRRMAPAAQDAGLATLTHRSDEYVLCDLVEWSGESYRAETWPTGLPGTPDGANLIRRWWVPPEPPPISILKWLIESHHTHQGESNE